MQSRLARRAFLVAAAAVAAAALFASLPALLVSTDPLPAAADAIFVFAGEVPERQRCAAELFRRGIAPRIVLSGGVVRPELAALGQPMTEAEVGARVARAAGVPEEAIVVVPHGTSTWEDVRVLERWARGSGARSVVAITSPLHSRRAARSLDLVLARSGVDVRLVACGPRLSPAAPWWLEERPLIAVTNEAAKLGLYTVRYFAPAALGLGGAPPAEEEDRAP